MRSYPGLPRRPRAAPRGRPGWPQALRRIALAAVLVLVPVAGEATAQETGVRTEPVSYVAPDGTQLSGVLVVPDADTPAPGVVVLSIAGTTPLVDALARRGFAVLTPERRGFVSVEPLLRATYADLAGDVAVGLEYLGARAEVDASRLAVLAQADDAPPAMLAGADARSFPLVLVAPPAFPGVETFRMEQRAQATRAGAGPAELEALDTYVGRIAEVALGTQAPYVREYRIQGLRAASPVELPRSAAFPSDERQAHFFASPLWHDRLAFEPESALSRLRGPVLAIIGADDADTPLVSWLEAVRRGLAASPSSDTSVCLLPGRTRHTFTPGTVDAIAGWLESRIGPGTRGTPGAPAGCLADPEA